MHTVMRAESWISGRETFMFRCNRSNGERWTFVIDRTALQNLDPDGEPALIFDEHRPLIYQAARRRMAIGRPDQQHVITAADIAGAA